MKHSLFLTLVLLLISNLYSQSINQSYLEHKVDSLVSQSHKPGGPGGAIVVVSHNKVLLKKAYGMMNLDYQLPNTDSTVFNLASVSKHFTAIAVLLLEKEGKLNLDDEIHKYLPDLPDFGQPITIRQLLHHTSGLPPTDILRLICGTTFESLWSSGDELDLISKYYKLNFKPNEEYLYSSSNYFLLAKIIEKISNKPFAIYLEDNILKPLGMKNSIVYDNNGKVILNKASGYRKIGDTYLNTYTEGESVYGPTNLYISANDAVLWSQNLLAPKQEFKEIIQRLITKCDKLNNGDTLEYTFGMHVFDYKGVQIVQHGGGTQGFRNQIMIFPKNDLALMIMFNNESFNHYKLATDIADLCLADKLQPETKKERKEISLNKQQLIKYAGSFLMSDGMELSFNFENDTLRLVIPNAPKFKMYAESEGEFFLKDFDAQCSFIKDNGGEYNDIIWHQGNQNIKGIRAAKHKKLTDNDKIKFTGNYYNSSLNVNYNLSKKNEQLILSIPKAFTTALGIDNNVKLLYVNTDRFFTGDLGMIEFIRNKNKVITGFRFVDVGRVRNVEFQKVN